MEDKEPKTGSGVGVEGEPDNQFEVTAKDIKSLDRAGNHELYRILDDISRTSAAAELAISRKRSSEPEDDLSQSTAEDINELLTWLPFHVDEIRNLIKRVREANSSESEN